MSYVLNVYLNMGIQPQTTYERRSERAEVVIFGSNGIVWRMDEMIPKIRLS